MATPAVAEPLMMKAVVSLELQAPRIIVDAAPILGQQLSAPAGHAPSCPLTTHSVLSTIF
jgi:hypothetical protein